MRSHGHNAHLKALFSIFIRPFVVRSSTLLQPAIRHIFSPQQLQTTRYARRNINVYAKVIPEGLVVRRKLEAALKDPKRPIDEDISAPMVHVVDETGKLGEATSLHHLLRDIDRSTQLLRKVGEIEEGIPVVKVFDKEKLYAEIKSTFETTKKDPADRTKQIELTWGISENDVNHRLRKLEEFLRDNLRVEVLIAAKRRGREDDPRREPGASEAHSRLRQPNRGSGGMAGAGWKDWWSDDNVL